ncbi:alpha/beta hydrolase [Trichothermofontia sp.]
MPFRLYNLRLPGERTLLSRVNSPDAVQSDRSIPNRVSWLKGRNVTLPRSLAAGAIGLLASLLAPLPVRGAERVTVTFGPLSQSVPIASLEQFVKDGTVDSALRLFIRFLKPEAREEVRIALGQHKQISASVLSQLLQDPMGEMMLQRTGEVVQTSAGLNGAQAVRSALVLAAASPEGVSVLEFLRHFPTNAVRLDVNRVLTIYRHSARFVRQTAAVVATTQQMCSKCRQQQRQQTPR